jgi:carbon-monoxide dehydrogenase medium subunit
VIRHRFTYEAPTDADEAVALLAAAPETTTVLSGGTWVVPELTRGQRRTGTIVDLRRAGLDHVRAAADGGLLIGAATTYATLAADPLVALRAPLLAHLAAGITGGAQLRNVATIGGSACYASPSSDVPGALVALAATLRVRGAGGRREVAAAAFFRGAFVADAGPSELLTDIAIPAPSSGSWWGYRKLKLCGSSWPIATAACVAHAAQDGRPAGLRLVLGGVGAVPLSVHVDGLAAPGSVARAELLAAVRAATADAVVEPYADDLADGDYRRRVAPVLATRAVEDVMRG